MKICNKCKISKELSEFYKDASRIDGKSNQCKKCNKEETKQHYLNNKEKIKYYYLDNKNYILEKNKQ